MNTSQKPTARREGLVIQETPDEVLVFDLETNQAHCLNQTAAFVWKSCDGQNSVTQIAAAVGLNANQPADENLVWLAIDQLSENNLLEAKMKADFNNQSRRDVIKKIGLAAVIALPLVSSLVAPTTASAVACSGVVASCGNCNDGTACVGANGGNGTCQSGVCVGGRRSTSSTTLTVPGQ